MRTFVVHILTNRSGTLYVGVTSNLARRLRVHREREIRGFTARYHLDRLVHAEVHSSAHEAIAREKQLKGWRRAKKVALIEATNPDWRDLADVYLGEEARLAGSPGRWARGRRRGLGEGEPEV